MRAFTLIELLVVLGLLAVAAGLIVPRMGGSIGRRELDEAAVRFAHTARTVRELAVSRQETCALQIDLDAGGYGVLVASGEAGAQSLTPVRASWLKPQRWPASIRASEYRTPEGRVAVRGQQRLTFMPDGTSSGASIRLSGEQGECVIVIHPHNGRAVVQEAGMERMSQDQYDLGD